MGSIPCPEFYLTWFFSAKLYYCLPSIPAYCRPSSIRYISSVPKPTFGIRRSKNIKYFFLGFYLYLVWGMDTGKLNGGLYVRLLALCNCYLRLPFYFQGSLYY